YGADGNAVATGDDFAGSGTTETRCALDPSTTPSSFADLPDACPAGGVDVSSAGAHVLYAASVDAAGNEEDRVASFPFRVGHRLSVTVNDDALGGSTVT